MRKEASIEQWKTLYEAGTRIKELKPWEKFWNMDLIGIRYGTEEPLPFTAFQFGNLLITDEALLSDLEKAPKCNAVLEAEVSVLGTLVTDKKYDCPANPALSVLGDANTGTIIKFEMLEPEDDAIVMLAEILIGFIFQFGVPKEIRVSNVIVEAGLDQICNVCGIKLRRVKRLKGLEDFKYSMQRFR